MPVKTGQNPVGASGIHVQALLRFHPGQDLELGALHDLFHRGLFDGQLQFALVLGRQVERHALASFHGLHLLPVGDQLLAHRQEFLLGGHDVALGLKLQISLGDFVNGFADGLAVRGNGQIDHDLLHLMLEIGGHGIGKRGVKATRNLVRP